MFELLLRISTTMFVSTAMLFSGAILAYFLEKKKLPVFSLIIIILLLTPIYLTRKYYRSYNKISYETNNSQFESGSNILTDMYSDEGQEKFDKFSNKLEKNTRTRNKKNRFENLSFISQLVYYHNKKKRPFLYGETFYWLPLTPIPRIIYPDKPLSEMAKEMPISYHLRGKGGTTAINFPMFAEAYINFGFWGILIMAFIFGLSFKWFAMKFGLGVGDLNLIIAINCFKQFTHAEGNITLVFGALIQVLLFWFVIIKIFKLDKWKEEAIEIA